MPDSYGIATSYRNYVQFKTAGVRFYKRGVSSDGHPANFVETEQIVETISGRGRRLTSFLQTRGSIPLLWSQRPNLKWQPMPTMKPSDDQLSAYIKHFENQKKTYGGQHILTLFNGLKQAFSERIAWIALIELPNRIVLVWADNGDECSRQYAGTGALKADFTRLGKRTYTGAINDGINAITRYFRNNFADGYRQDAMDVFLGNFIIDVHNLPSSLEATLISLDQNGIALLAACFAMAMTILCVLVAENISATLFWLAVFLICMMFIFINGEEFVNAPKLKQD
ncbi:hypothetical protein TELCIR_01182 [Teladorsagia circumcincta]|uniref:Phosphatidylinositol-3-phosphatase SAC1 n=1 Tax=Teladorsagia circumcincta TaxID=45464 RepID=A0A2G9V2L2_TELCI|nr:hypothetical protein TELCIR_01182 [Teladorsagia circumcincta]